MTRLSQFNKICPDSYNKQNKKKYSDDCDSYKLTSTPPSALILVILCWFYLCFCFRPCGRSLYSGTSFSNKNLKLALDLVCCQTMVQKWHCLLCINQATQTLLKTDQLWQVKNNLCTKQKEEITPWFKFSNAQQQTFPWGRVWEFNISLFFYSNTHAYSYTLMYYSSCILMY